MRDPMCWVIVLAAAGILWYARHAHVQTRAMLCQRISALEEQVEALRAESPRVLDQIQALVPMLEHLGLDLRKVVADCQDLVTRP